jgi:hypothetical protein
MRESRTYGSVRGALSNERPYRDRCARNDDAVPQPHDVTSGLFRPLNPDHAAFLHRQRQLTALQFQCGLAEQLAAPAA